MGETRIVQIDAPLLAQVERLASEMDTSPAEFIEAAVEAAVESAQRDRETERWERELVESYRRQPQTDDELGDWEDIQAWPEP